MDSRRITLLPVYHNDSIPGFCIPLVFDNLLRFPSDLPSEIVACAAISILRYALTLGVPKRPTPNASHPSLMQLLACVGLCRRCALKCVLLP